MHLQPSSILREGKYRINKSLGQGGFGITYEAELGNLGRIVAIKEFFMRDCCERASDNMSVTVGTGTQRLLVQKFRNKFLKEAYTIAGFNHPNIVRIHDIFEENGTAYYVMDYFSGGTLADIICNSGPMSEGLAIKYIKEIASALKYIHEHRTVHLDVKPSNVILDDKGNAVLIDFGTSKHYDSAGDQTTTTPIGFSKGFAPIEQYLAGDVSQFNPATDIYALGATLYNLVTGDIPPEASLVLSNGLIRVNRVSDVVWNIITKAMRPIWKERPQSINEFLQLFDDESTIVKPPFSSHGEQGKESFNYLTNDGRVRVYTQHGKSWFAVGDDQISDYYDEVVASTLVDDCIVCTKRNNLYGYTYIDIKHQCVKSTPHKYLYPTAIRGIKSFFYGESIGGLIDSPTGYDAIIENNNRDSSVILTLKKYSGHYVIGEQGFKYYPKTKDKQGFWILLIGSIIGFPVAGLTAAGCFGFNLVLGAIIGLVLGVINTLAQRKDCFNPAHLEAFGSKLTVLDSNSKPKQQEALRTDLAYTKAAVYRNSNAPICDSQTKLECPKTGADFYYRIERAGRFGMRHMLEDGRIQELFPFDGEDDIDFEDAWLRLRPSEE